MSSFRIPARGTFSWPTTFVAGAFVVAAASSTHAQAPRFERDVYPFTVLDETGTAIAHPFLGGLNLPRPQLADIDQDGDLDLFIQEYSGSVMFFERTDDGAHDGYRWRTDTYQDADVGEWFHFYDVDKDGDLDLLGEQRFSLIRYFRNDPADGVPRLNLLTETVLDPAGKPVFSDRQNIPKIGDLDCDGRLDLLIGRVEGIITRYEEVGTDDLGAPTFRHVEDRFQNIEIIGQLPGISPQQVQQVSASNRGTLHGANTMALEDLDGDGDLDLFWGDFFEAGVLYIENRGSCRSPSMRGEPEPFPAGDPIMTTGYNAPSFGDIDGDGDLDMLVGVLGGAFNPNDSSIDNLLMLENVGRNVLEHRTRRFLSQIDVGSESVPALADIDADGDLDLFLANKIEPGDTGAGRIFFFENIGSAEQPRFHARGAVDGFDAFFHYAPTFGDLDADGDLDMVLGTWEDELQWLRNDGTAQRPEWSVAAEELVKLSRGRNAVPTLGDVDGDGDLDLMVGESSGELNFYRNVGDASAPQFELVDDKYLAVDVGRRSAPTLVDVDGDGDLDVVLGSESEGLILLRNNGGRTSPSWVVDETWTVAVHPYSTPAFVDIDADGILDLFAGGTSGGLIFLAGR